MGVEPPLVAWEARSLVRSIARGHMAKIANVRFPQAQQAAPGRTATVVIAGLGPRSGHSPIDRSRDCILSSSRGRLLNLPAPDQEPKRENRFAEESDEKKIKVGFGIKVKGPKGPHQQQK
jgi:hypothetical protein